MKNVGFVENDCFGCSACKCICPVGAINFIESNEKFLVPAINKAKCLECGLCTEVCPAVHKWCADSTSNEAQIYAFSNQDNAILTESTSGGFFSEAITKYSADYVCGCIQDDNFLIKHVVSNSDKTISMMRGSKYVQSNMENCFNEIKDNLKQGKKVLFSGTSCQVDGLNRFLKRSRIDSSNLLTIDLVCHGVPSPGIYRDFIKFYEKEKKKPKRHWHRSKYYGWGVELGIANYIQTISTETRKDYTSLAANIWINAFFSDYCIRECCYNCPYTSINKPADLTMGDFWGVNDFLQDKKYLGKGYSLVISRTPKSDKLVKKIDAYHIKKNATSMVISKQSRLQKPINMPDNRAMFWEEYIEKGFEHIVKKYYRYTTVNKLILSMYFISLRLGFRKLATKLARQIFY